MGLSLRLSSSVSARWFSALWAEAASQRVATSHHIDIIDALATGAKALLKQPQKHSATRTKTLRKHPRTENIPRAE
jgi:hypothetical protein